MRSCILMMAPTIAIAGATGLVGKHITNALLQAFKQKFQDVILLSRKASSPELDEWAQGGAMIRVYDEKHLSKSLEGIDILINAVGGSYEFKSALIEAIAENHSIKLYFPSELGVDHTVHDFPAIEWDRKKNHYAQAQRLLGPKNIKICRVYTGLFLEESIGPWFGFNTKEGIYEMVGSADAKVAFTSLKDVGAAMVAIAALPLSEVPEELRIAGDNVSARQISEIMISAGAGAISITSIPITEYKEKVVKAQQGTETFLRFLMGEEKIDHSHEGLGNSNELLNPGQALWKWKTMKDLALDTNGKPWADFDWNPSI